MAVKLRLMRMGKTKQPTYRVVAADSRSPRDGRFIEIVGSYAPRQEENKVVLKAERVAHWLGEGAQPTDRVRRLLVGAGLIEGAPARPAKPRRAPSQAAGQEGQVSDPYNRVPGGTARAVLEYLARHIVDEPDAVEVETSGGADGQPVRLSLQVGPGDVGRVIGRRGRTAQAIRAVTRAAAARDGEEVFVDIVD